MPTGPANYRAKLLLGKTALRHMSPDVDPFNSFPRQAPSPLSIKSYHTHLHYVIIISWAHQVLQIDHTFVLVNHFGQNQLQYGAFLQLTFVPLVWNDTNNFLVITDHHRWLSYVAIYSDNASQKFHNFFFISSLPPFKSHSPHRT